jgi:hypothetical protein
MRTAMLVPIVALAGCLIARAEQPKDAAFDVHDGYFVSNQFEPQAPASFLVLKDQASFDKVFHATPPLMGQKKTPELVPADAFETKIVAAVVHRGSAEWTYKVQSAQAEGKTLVVHYTAKSRKAGFEMAAPLIVSVPKGGSAAVRFVENGKAVKTIPFQRQ